MNYKVISCIIITVVALFNAFMEYLDWKSMKNRIPENVNDIYDEETYKKWCSYHKEKCRLKFITSIVSFVVGLSAFAFNVYACFAGIFPDTAFWGMAAVTILYILLDVFVIPLDYYDKMKIEEKYGFNRSTKGTFWGDKLKEYLIGLIVYVLIGCLFIFLHQKLGDWLILAFAAALIVIMFLIAFLFPVFSKIFNKFTPLEDGELKDRLTELLVKNGYSVKEIKVMDASKRSTKMNAYFAGFGKMKTIVLYDTLKEAMTTDEICAVFAHEMGHGLHKDTLKGQITTFIQMFVLSAMAWFTVRTPELFTDFGFDKINYGFAMIVILNVGFAFVMPLFGLISNYFSRKREFRADAQAVKEGYGEALISALKVLAKNNYANLSPDPLVVKLTYSHPTLSQRFEAIRRNN